MSVNDVPGLLLTISPTVQRVRWSGSARSKNAPGTVGIATITGAPVFGAGIDAEAVFGSLVKRHGYDDAGHDCRHDDSTDRYPRPGWEAMMLFRGLIACRFSRSLLNINLRGRRGFQSRLVSCQGARAGLEEEEQC